MRWLALVAVACAGDPVDAQSGGEEAPPVAAEGVRAVTPGGAELRAARAELGPEGAVAVDVAVEVPGEQPLAVRAERASWDMKTQGLTLEGEVRATRGPFALECDRLALEVGEDGTLTRAVATGRVRLRRQTWTAAGELAELDLPSGVLVLTGSPQVSDGRGQLRGERVILHLDDERVECERCELVLPDPRAGR